MKKEFFLWLFLPIFIFNIFICQSSSKRNDIVISTKKIENSKQIVIGYTISSYVAIIKDQEEIKQLENLINGAEFTKSDAEIQHPYLNVSFSGENGSITFYIDDNDVIKLRDGNYIKSKQISFSKLYSIFYNYSVQKK